jgi:hypothetical protein
MTAHPCPYCGCPLSRHRGTVHTFGVQSFEDRTVCYTRPGWREIAWTFVVLTLVVGVMLLTGGGLEDTRNQETDHKRLGSAGGRVGRAVSSLEGM